MAAGLLIAGEALLATRRSYLGGGDAPATQGRVPGPGEPVRLVVLGDSTGAGVGATARSGTVGAQVAARLGRAVDYRSVAVSGARAADLGGQVDAALRSPADVAVVVIGANDATHLSRGSSVRREVAAAVRRLRAAGLSVVVGTCPELRSARNFLQPLRSIVGRRGDRIAAATRDGAIEAGAIVVDLAAETGPAFLREPDRYLSEDRFHPSDEGYALWADALAPAAKQALRATG